MSSGRSGWMHFERSMGLAVSAFFLGGCGNRALPNEVSDLTAPDLDLAVQAKPDLRRLDLAMRDSAESLDLPMPDLGTPDLSVPDLATPDLATPDLTTPDLMPSCSSVSVSTLAGNGTFGSKDGTGGPSGTTEFYGPYGLAVDGAGNVYVSDLFNSPRIRKVAPDGTTSTLAGNGFQGFVDGTGGPAGTTEFYSPYGVAVGGTGNVYVADSGNYRIRKVAPDGSTTTFAGNGTSGFFDGTGGPSGTTMFVFPFAVAVDSNENVFVADAARVRKIAADGTTSTLAGNGAQGFFDGSGGPLGTTEFGYIQGLAVDMSGNVYAADTNNDRIRKIAPDGSTTTLAGNGASGAIDGTGGPAGTTTFNRPIGVAVDVSGTVYVVDRLSQRVRRVDPSGNTITIAGSALGFRDGNGCSALFYDPAGVALWGGHSLFVADEDNSRVRAIQPAP